MNRVIPKNTWKDSDVEAHWDEVASVYVKENERVKDTHDQRFVITMKLLQLGPKMKVLNISSRDGEARDYIEREEPDCVVKNAEISAGLMKVAGELRPGIRQVKIETYSCLPFADETFDRILSLETLEHVAEPLSFLEELHRVCTPDAILVLTCPPATSEIPYRIYTALFGGHGEGPHRFPPSKRVKLMFEKTAWELIHHRGTILLPVGPPGLKRLAEQMMKRFQKTFISELGIRQVYVCKKR